MSTKGIKLWVKSASKSSVDLCSSVEEQLAGRLERINENEGGIEERDTSLPNAKPLIEDLGKNAQIILNNACDNAGIKTTEEPDSAVS